tara:strand:+ start:70476 stop:70700 length:225 start_codon:yes stop_codon:yes gene_type:complete
MKKIIQKFFQMLSGPSGKLNLKNKNRKKNLRSESVQYFEAKMFFNDLDNPDDYYLRVSSTSKNEFVRKDTLNDN